MSVTKYVHTNIALPSLNRSSFNDCFKPE